MHPRHRPLALTAVSAALLACAACASPPAKRYGEVAGQLAVKEGSSQVLVYTLERAGVDVQLDGRWIGYLVTDSGDTCSFIFSDATPGSHQVSLQPDNAPPVPDPDNVTPHDEMDIVLQRDQRLALVVESKRELLFSKPKFARSGSDVPSGCVYVGPQDELTRRGVSF